MQNILVCDHSCNTESLAALSSKYQSLKFFIYNNKYSLNDHYDLMKPNLILVNQSLYADLSIPDSVKCNISYYKAPNFIVNNFTAIHSNRNKIPICIMENLQQIEPEPFILSNNYIKIYGLIPATQPTHFQYVGHIASTRALHDLISRHETVITDGSKVLDICNHMQCKYGYYKARGTISIHDQCKNPYLHNEKIYEQYISNFL